MTPIEVIAGTPGDHSGLWVSDITPFPGFNLRDDLKPQAKWWIRKLSEEQKEQMRSSSVWSCFESAVPFYTEAAAILCSSNGNTPVTAATIPTTKVEQQQEQQQPGPDTPAITPFDACPMAMREARRWVMWKREPRTNTSGEQYQTKVPYQVNGRRAKSSDPTTWSGWDDVIRCFQDNPGKYAGIGFNAGDDPDTGKRWIGADVDKLYDPDTGNWKDPEALSLLLGLCSYAEYSPSGTGGRVFGWGYLTGDRRKSGAYEIYDGFNQKGEPGGRFLTFTGNRIGGAPTEIRDVDPEGLAAFERKLCGDASPKIPKPKVDRSTVAGAAISEDVLPIRPEDDQIIQMIRKSKQGDKFGLLFDDPDGWKQALDGEGNAFKSPSEARYSLISILYWWTRDLISTHAIMSRSALAAIDPEKWERLGAGEVAQIAGTMQQDGIETDPPWAGSYGWSEEGLPRIGTNTGDTPSRTKAALDAIRAKNNPPSLFVRSGVMVEVISDETGIPTIQTVEQHRIRSILGRCAKWIRFNKTGTFPDVVAPDTPLDILFRPHEEWKIPAIVGVTPCPIIRQDGSIPGPGYDPESRMYYAPAPGFILPNVPDRPTKADVEKSMVLIKEVFHDFPFVSDADRANTYGALFTACLRPLIGDIVPLYLVDKPQRGTGASKLQDTISTLATGTVTSPTAMPKSDEEMEKKIFSILRAGSSLVILDNLAGTLRSDDLASVLTSRSYKGRILGRTEQAVYKNNVFWMANGNNVLIGGDLARRIWVTRLDAQLPAPWKRTGFLHPDLIQWCTQERGRILAAVLTIARSWIQAGRPDDPTVPNVGSFERWRAVIAGILCHAGVKGFYANADDVVEQSDEDQNEWEIFLLEMQKLMGSTPWTVKDLATRLRKEQAGSVYNTDQDGKHIVCTIRISDTLPGPLAAAWHNPKTAFHNAAGKHLSKLKDRRFNAAVVLRSAGKFQKIQAWKVETPKETQKTLEAGGD